MSHLCIDYHLPAQTPQRALQNITFRISRGEVVGLVGESGSGKSTLALAMTGLLPHNASVAAGSIRFRGSNIQPLGDGQMQAIRGAQIALLPQEPAIGLNPAMRVGEQLSEVLRAHRNWSRDERREAAGRVLREVGLPEIERLQSAYPHELGRSERLRTAIALALVCRPAVLIADEPTSAQDAATQAAVLAYLKRTHALLGTAVLVISRDPAALSGWVQRALVLQEGEVLEQTSVAQLMERAVRVFTCGVLASICTEPQQDGVRWDPELRQASNGSGYRTRPLVAKGVCRRYAKSSFLSRVLKGSALHGLDALHDVSLALREGTTTALVGEPGSGKSTLARCLAAVEQPDGGQIWLEGRELSGHTTEDVRRMRRRVQLLIQPAAAIFNPRFSLEEIVSEPLQLRGFPVAVSRTQAYALMDRVGLPPAWRERSPTELRGEARLRLALARALAADPKVLILDEVLFGLDMPAQARMVQLLLELQATLSLAYLFITQDLRMAGYVADEMAVMHGGRIVDYGSPAEIFSYPRHGCTQALLDLVPGISEESLEGSWANR